MTRLSVNVNKVATLRNTRSVGVPSVAHCARLCLDAGAHGITVHPRPDERHIRFDDVRDIAKLLKSLPHAELNIEGNPFHGLMAYAERFRPTQCTLVPDEPAQATSDHGWSFERDAERLRPIIAKLREFGVRVSLFIDADARAVERAHEIGADRVELYTEPYATAYRDGTHDEIVSAFASAAAVASSMKLGVNAGHDLNLANLGPFLARLPGVAEVSIGHALIADALEYGLPTAVRKYLAAIADVQARVHVLFVCWHNSARSQMAAALLAKHDGFVVASAGTHAATAIHPMVVEVMRELGVDLGSARPRQLSDDLIADADVVVRCLAPDPDDYVWPRGSVTFHDWSVPMPVDEDHPTIAEMRALRDALSARVTDLVARLQTK